MSKHLYGGDEIPTSEIEVKKAELARLERSPSKSPSPLSPSTPSKIIVNIITLTIAIT